MWCVIGGVAEATSKLQLGTGVTCPTVRIHPAIVAQAAATAAAMMEGRFFLGVGSIHQVGPDQEGFIRFSEREALPQVTKARRKTAA